MGRSVGWLAMPINMISPSFPQLSNPTKEESKFEIQTQRFEIQIQKIHSSLNRIESLSRILHCTRPLANNTRACSRWIGRGEGQQQMLRRGEMPGWAALPACLNILPTRAGPLVCYAPAWSLGAHRAGGHGNAVRSSIRRGGVILRRKKGNEEVIVVVRAFCRCCRVRFVFA